MYPAIYKCIIFNPVTRSVFGNQNIGVIILLLQTYKSSDKCIGIYKTVEHWRVIRIFPIDKSKEAGSFFLVIHVDSIIINAEKVSFSRFDKIKITRLNIAILSCI